MRHKGKKRTKTRKSLLLGPKCNNNYTRYYWFTCDKPTNKLDLLYTTRRAETIQGGDSYYIDPITNMVYKQYKNGSWVYKKWFLSNNETTIDSKVAHEHTVATTIIS